MIREDGRGVVGGPNGGWAQPIASVIRGYTTGSDPAAMTQPGPCMVNCNNIYSVYAFHTGGANVSLTDGSVRFPRASASAGTVAALVTRAGGEVMTRDW